MKLISCYAENFGMLSGFHFDFNGKLNTVLLPNGGGKSTLAAFIKSMFYGLPETKKKDIDSNDRIKYLPWQGGGFGGNIVFAINDKRYKIERFFGAKTSGGDDTFGLYDLTYNKKSSDYSARIGEELFGINADSFERTVYIPQKTLSADVNTDILSRLNNLINNTDDAHSYDNAAEALKTEERNLSTTGNRGYIYEVLRRIAEAETGINACRNAAKTAAILGDELKKKRRETAETESRLIAVKNGIEASSALLLKAEKQKHYRYLQDRVTHGAELIAAYGKRFKNGAPPAAQDIKAAYKKSLELMEAENRSGSNAFYSGGADEAATAKRVPPTISGLDEAATARRIPPVIKYLTAVGIILLTAGIVICFFNLTVGLIIAVASAVFTVFTVYYAKRQRGEESGEAVPHDRNIADTADGIEAARIRRGLEAFFGHYTDVPAKASGKDYAEAAIGLERILDALNKAYSDYESDLDKLEAFLDGGDAVEYQADIMPPDTAALKRAEKDAEMRMSSLAAEIAVTDRRLCEADGQAAGESDFESALGEAKEEYAEVAKRLEILRRTREMLARAKENLSSAYLKPLTAGCQKYMEFLTKGKESLSVDTELDINIERGGQLRRLGYFSTGVKEVVNTAMRFALIETLFKDEKPFVILDDPFVNLDDGKLVNAKELLEILSEYYQIIYFTCSSGRDFQ
ncbi:MAG: AAA family ATPase [Clostridiales bacterium]|jgi:DNA repair exonuclease SbcCD ATPase subunit|nr:AAA family ATPase [Clostridiales bacterium]